MVSLYILYVIYSPGHLQCVLCIYCIHTVAVVSILHGSLLRGFEELLTVMYVHTVKKECINCILCMVQVVIMIYSR